MHYRNELTYRILRGCHDGCRGGNRCGRGGRRCGRRDSGGSLWLCHRSGLGSEILPGHQHLDRGSGRYRFRGFRRDRTRRRHRWYHRHTRVPIVFPGHWTVVRMTRRQFHQIFYLGHVEIPLSFHCKSTKYRCIFLFLSILISIVSTIKSRRYQV